ncbi:hypothetical protein RAB80_008353 [Fusarium oxysporum f. sp. vasinfectum]|uniref:Uncharacterized protein n=1 Tax=Fusarium oxysporum TaxID=5507 RepID=A0A2H3T9K5_FUSOX|nr:hypothetical protein FOXYS1_6421 [Fusarium oxysporum]KAK2676167.1 hypothetical protein RAB80_008353 [Fusarium oxysporum f. sp. vasinfectum]SCO85418.1 uncharacterized protein FRV6_09545 [Fusarium oxysporum]
MTSHEAARLRQGLLPLTTTSVGAFNNPLHTPISAVSMSSSHFHSAVQTPGSSIQPYNPQEWVPTQAAVAERAVQYAGEVQGNVANAASTIQSAQKSTAASHEYRLRLYTSWYSDSAASTKHNGASTFA